MAVLRIVANVHAADPAAMVPFYRDLLGLDVAMDQGWIVTFAAPAATTTSQLSVAAEGGSGTALPSLSIEVDDIDAVLERVRAAGHAIVYGPADEPWGVRRFYVSDPAGHLVNILAHVR